MIADAALHSWVYHDRSHIQQIGANIQTYVRQSMGNAQRFILAPPPGT